MVVEIFSYERYLCEYILIKTILTGQEHLVAKGHNKQAENLTSAYEDAAPICASPNTHTHPLLSITLTLSLSRLHF